MSNHKSKRKIYWIFWMLMLFSAVFIILIQISDNSGMKLFSDKSVKEAQTDKKIVTLYQNNCANCHGPSGEGYDPYPTLKGQQLPVDYVKEMIMEGSGDMPAFPYIKDPDLTKLAVYVNQMQ